MGIVIIKVEKILLKIEISGNLWISLTTKSSEIQSVLITMLHLFIGRVFPTTTDLGTVWIWMSPET